MPTPGKIEEQIAEWRGFLRRRQGVRDVDVDELEAHLRDQVAVLVAAGLTDDEAFLVSVKRMGDLDELSREYAQEHSDRLWKQLVAPAEATLGSGGVVEPIVVVGLAIGAALAVKAPTLAGYHVSPNEELDPFYFSNASFFVLPFLTAYFAWRRRLAASVSATMALLLGVGALLINFYPFRTHGDTWALAVLHLPIALWIVVIGVAYTAGRWRYARERMNFVRFSGELLIYFSLIALGGMVLTGLTAFMLSAIGYDPGQFVGTWLLPCGAAGAVLISSWLVEAKQSVIENMAPVLTMVFTPLFVLALCGFLATMALSGRGINVEREVLIGFDLLLAIVLGLLLYSISARDLDQPPGPFEALQLLLILLALVVDALALAAILGRISEFGFSPNKVAALGENLILLVNLAWTSWLYLGFLRRRRRFDEIERWQMAYLPVYAAWAAFVIVAFGPMFGYV